jgi:hypothetical protein
MGKDDRKNVFFLNFFRPNFFDMYFPKKTFYGVFELPLLRNAQKRHKTNLNIKKKKSTYLPHLVAICQIYGGFNFIFLGRPLSGFLDLVRVVCALPWSWGLEDDAALQLLLVGFAVCWLRWNATSRSA